MTLVNKLLVAVTAAAIVTVLIIAAAWFPGTNLSSESAMLAAAEIALEPHRVEAPPKPLYDYVVVSDSCGPDFDGECVNIRKGPGENFPVVAQLRAGAVLQAEEKVQADGREWYKLTYNEWLRYPERAGRNLYIAAQFVEPFRDEGIKEVGEGEQASSTKMILVDRSSQKLYAYDGEELFMEETVSTGLELTPTPRGTFSVYKKTPTRYMQGPIPGISDQYYDLPGVPWNLYFTNEGAVIHGAYWHDKFGKPWSHGCVNLPPEKARILYSWAELGTRVIVRD
ncbi:MAG: hypothetical protein RIQ56_906 [Candidatus Parcubacteria bacterium]